LDLPSTFSFFAYTGSAFQNPVSNIRSGVTELLFLFFYSVIFVHKLDITKREYIICLQIFLAATLPNITKVA